MKWIMLVIDGSEEHLISCVAPAHDIAQTKALRFVEEKYGTSSWRVKYIFDDLDVEEVN